MGVKEISSTVLILLGIAGLIIGMFGIFGEDMTKQNPWIFAILGFIFFISGISLLKSANR
jgi:hypothetical protein